MGDCRKKWGIVSKRGGLLDREEDCREKKEEDCRKEWRIVSKRGGLLDRVEDCTLEARSAGGPLV